MFEDFLLRLGDCIVVSFFLIVKLLLQFSFVLSLLYDVFLHKQSTLLNFKIDSPLFFINVIFLFFFHNLLNKLYLFLHVFIFPYYQIHLISLIFLFGLNLFKKFLNFHFMSIFYILFFQIYLIIYCQH